MYAEDLKSTNIVYSSHSSIYVFAIFAFLYGVVAVIILLAEEGVEQKIRYDNIPGCMIGFEKPTYGKECIVEMRIEMEMKLPLFVYYEITNFYQNHQIFKTSFSREQQSGKYESSYDECEPLERFQGKIIYPCGLLPNAVFSDKIIASVSNENGDTDLVPGNLFSGYSDSLKSWQKEGIAWKTDLEGLKNMDVNSERFRSTFIRKGQEQQKIIDQTKDEDIMLPLPKDEDLVVWQRISPWTNFRKLYRRIFVINDEKKSMSLKKGDVIRFKIKNYFRVDGKKQTKSIVLSTKSWIRGNKKLFMLTCLLISLVCFLSTVAACVNILFFPRKIEDINLL